MPRRRLLEAVSPEAPPSPVTGQGRLVWILGLGAFGLAWSITTVAAYRPPLLGKFTESSTLIGLVLAAEGVFAVFVPLLVGPMSDATQASFGRRRPYMALALVPWRSRSRASPSWRASTRPPSRSSPSSSRTTSTSRRIAGCIPTARGPGVRARAGRPAHLPAPRWEAGSWAAASCWPSGSRPRSSSPRASSSPPAAP